MSLDLLGFVPASEPAPSSSRVGGHVARDGGARGQDSFADMVGRLVDQRKSPEKPARSAEPAATRAATRVATKGVSQPIRPDRPDTAKGDDEVPVEEPQGAAPRETVSSDKPKVGGEASKDDVENETVSASAEDAGVVEVVPQAEPLPVPSAPSQLVPQAIDVPVPSPNADDGEPAEEPAGEPEVTVEIVAAATSVETVVPEVRSQRAAGVAEAVTQVRPGEAAGHTRVEAQVVPPSPDRAPEDPVAAIPTVSADQVTAPAPAPAPRVPARAIENSPALREAAAAEDVPAEAKEVPPASQETVIQAPQGQTPQAAAQVPGPRNSATSGVVPKGIETQAKTPPPRAAFAERLQAADVAPKLADQTPELADDSAKAPDLAATLAAAVSQTAATPARASEQGGRAASARGFAAADAPERFRSSLQGEWVWSAATSGPATIAANVTRVMATAAPIRLEADVLSAKTAVAYQPASVASGLPFALDLQAALRPTEAAAQVAASSTVQRPADTQDVPRQIVQAAHLQWRDGVGEARLRLNPEHLGEVTISLRVEQGSVFATVRAESPAALQAIQSRQQELQAALEAQGLRLDHLVASTDPDERRDQSQYRAPRQAQRRTAPQEDGDAPRFEVLM